MRYFDGSFEAGSPEGLCSRVQLSSDRYMGIRGRLSCLFATCWTLIEEENAFSTAHTRQEMQEYCLCHYYLLPEESWKKKYHFATHFNIILQHKIFILQHISNTFCNTFQKHISFLPYPLEIILNFFCFLLLLIFT